MEVKYQKSNHTRTWESFLPTTCPGQSTIILSKAYRKLGLVRRTFSVYCTVSTRKKLYISLIRSQLIYGSQIWRPMLSKDIQKLERLQRRATKFILLDYSSDYRDRLLSLKLLPLMMVYELNDIMFFVTNFKEPSKSFDITRYVSLSSSNTRSNSRKLSHTRQATNTRKHFYFNRLVHLWNAFPTIDLSLSSDTIKENG